MANDKSNRFIKSLGAPVIFIGILVIIQLLSTILGLQLGVYGIYPRDLTGFRGVFLAPLLHSGWPHLISNAPPLFFMSVIILFFYRKVGFQAISMIYVLTGIAVWLFGRSVFHIGASGVVYGLVAFVAFLGIFRKNIKSIALSLIVVFYYGSMFVGILPGQEGISWESHLFGALVGIFVAYWFKGNIEKDEEKKVYSWEEEEKNLPPRNFFDQDPFEKTKRERLEDNQENRHQPPKWFSNY
jgi:membrane associated rhomboid family serine protease